jgi:hypothetical protein
MEHGLFIANMRAKRRKKQEGAAQKLRVNTLCVQITRIFVTELRTFGNFNATNLSVAKKKKKKCVYSICAALLHENALNVNHIAGD